MTDDYNLMYNNKIIIKTVKVNNAYGLDNKSQKLISKFQIIYQLYIPEDVAGPETVDMLLNPASLFAASEVVVPPFTFS